MTCKACQNIPLDLFLGDRSIQYRLHSSLLDFCLSALSGCPSCIILLEQRDSQIDHDVWPLYAARDGDSYWIEWDDQDSLVLASGMNHYYLDYESESRLRTTDITPDLSPASSSESFRIIRLWLDKCLGEHKSCHSERGTTPTRLLDVGPADGSQDPRIVYGAQLTDQKAQYLALSHCWGKSTKQSSWNLKEANIEMYMRGISINQLPQSFCDIIKLTRSLGERYVWIDQLCILQDSAEDCDKEVASMTNVYAGALCTLISPAAGPAQSLFVERDSSRTRPATLQLSPRNGGPAAAVRFLPVLPTWTVESSFGFESTNRLRLHENQPTKQRAWCLQEYELSRRTVTFTTHQFAWVCREMQCSEEEFSPISRTFSTSTLQDSRFNRNLMEPPGLYRYWEKLVEEYTARTLTQPSDRLIAVAGLAEQRHRETNDQYLAGLWESNLKSEFLWCVRDPTKSSRIAELSKVPTWSWGAVNSPVYFPHRPYALRMFESRMPSPNGVEISIESVEIDTAGQNAFTAATPARITIEGKLMRASIRNAEVFNLSGHDVSRGLELVDTYKMSIGRVVLDDQELRLETLAIKCLWIDAGIAESMDLEPAPERYTGGFGLALSHEQDAEDEDVYTRIGFVRFDPRILKQIHEVKRSRFTIV